VEYEYCSLGYVSFISSQNSSCPTKSNVFLFEYCVKNPTRFQLVDGFSIPVRPEDNYQTLFRTMGELVVPLANHLPGNKNPAHPHLLLQSYF
jgi:hypothetical protein